MVSYASSAMNGITYLAQFLEGQIATYPHFQQNRDVEEQKGLLLERVGQRPNYQPDGIARLLRDEPGIALTNLTLDQLNFVYGAILDTIKQHPSEAAFSHALNRVSGIAIALAVQTSQFHASNPHVKLG